MRPVVVWTVIGALVVSLAGSSTAAYASNQALPGDTLYPVKLWVEGARLTASLTAAGDAALHTEFAARRLAEAESLVQAGRLDAANEVLARYALTLQAALTEAKQSGNAQAAAALQTQLEAQVTTLQALQQLPAAQTALELNVHASVEMMLAVESEPASPTATRTQWASASETPYSNFNPTTFPATLAAVTRTPIPPTIAAKITSVSGTLAARATSIPQTVEARITRIAPTLAALPTSIPQTVEAKLTQIAPIITALPSSIPETLTALPPRDTPQPYPTPWPWPTGNPWPTDPGAYPTYAPTEFSGTVGPPRNVTPRPRP